MTNYFTCMWSLTTYNDIFPVKKMCRNLTETDAPENGGLICHWYPGENSQHCSVVCNEGYEHTPEMNSYEFCGPSSGYLWSHELTKTNSSWLCIGILDILGANLMCFIKPFILFRRGIFPRSHNRGRVSLFCASLP